MSGSPTGPSCDRRRARCRRSGTGDRRRGRPRAGPRAGARRRRHVVQPVGRSRPCHPTRSPRSASTSRPRSSRPGRRRAAAPSRPPRSGRWREHRAHRLGQRTVGDAVRCAVRRGQAGARSPAPRRWSSVRPACATRSRPAPCARPRPNARARPSTPRGENGRDPLDAEVARRRRRRGDVPVVGPRRVRTGHTSWWTAGASIRPSSSTPTGCRFVRARRRTVGRACYTPRDVGPSSRGRTPCAPSTGRLHVEERSGTPGGGDRPACPTNSRRCSRT